MPTQDHHAREQGFIMLFGVLIAGALGLTIALSLILGGTDAGQTSYALQQSSSAKALLNACLERALLDVQNPTFINPGSLDINGNICDYSISTINACSRLIRASSTVGTSVRKASLQVDAVCPDALTSSWLEVNDF